MSGKKQKVVITSDKGRLSESEIERMVKEAEENAEADSELREGVEAKNMLESYLYGVKASMQDGLKDKVSEEEKTTVNNAVTDALKWLESHPTDKKNAYDTKRKEVEAVANPVITKAYGAGPPGSAAAGASGAAEQEQSTSSADAANESNEPTIEEVE